MLFWPHCRKTHSRGKQHLKTNKRYFRVFECRTFLIQLSLLISAQALFNCVIMEMKQKILNSLFHKNSVSAVSGKTDFSSNLSKTLYCWDLTASYDSVTIYAPGKTSEFLAGYLGFGMCSHDRFACFSKLINTAEISFKQPKSGRSDLRRWQSWSIYILFTSFKMPNTIDTKTLHPVQQIFHAFRLWKCSQAGCLIIPESRANAIILSGWAAVLCTFLLTDFF